MLNGRKGVRKMKVSITVQGENVQSSFFVLLCADFEQEYKKDHTLRLENGHGLMTELGSLNISCLIK